MEHEVSALTDDMSPEVHREYIERHTNINTALVAAASEKCIDAAKKLLSGDIPTTLEYACLDAIVQYRNIPEVATVESGIFFDAVLEKTLLTRSLRSKVPSLGTSARPNSLSITSGSGTRTVDAYVAEEVIPVYPDDILNHIVTDELKGDDGLQCCHRQIIRPQHLISAEPAAKYNDEAVTTMAIETLPHYVDDPIHTIDFNKASHQDIAAGKVGNPDQLVVRRLDPDSLAPDGKLQLIENVDFHDPHALLGSMYTKGLSALELLGRLVSQVEDNGTFYLTIGGGNARQERSRETRLLLFELFKLSLKKAGFQYADFDNPVYYQDWNNTGQLVLLPTVAQMFPQYTEEDVYIVSHAYAGLKGILVRVEEDKKKKITDPKFLRKDFDKIIWDAVNQAARFEERFPLMFE